MRASKKDNRGRHSNHPERFRERVERLRKMLRLLDTQAVPDCLIAEEARLVTEAYWGGPLRLAWLELRRLPGRALARALSLLGPPPEVRRERGEIEKGRAIIRRVKAVRW